MRTYVVGFKQEEVTQLALESEVPALCIRSRELRLENVVAGQRENDGQQFVAVVGKRTGYLRRDARNVSTFVEDTAGEAIRSEEVKEELKISLERRIRARVAEEVGEHAVVENTEAAANRHLGWTTGQFGDPAAVPGRAVVEAEAWSEVIEVVLPKLQIRVRRVLAYELEFESTCRRWAAGILINEGRHLTIHFVRHAVVVPAQAVVQREVWSNSPGVLEVDAGFTHAVTTILLVYAS